MIHEASYAAGEVVLVLDAGTEAGTRLARKLLCDGYRVAISSRHTTDLAPIMHGYPSCRVLAVAADPDDPVQRSRLVARVRDYFGTDRLYTVASPTFVAEKVAATHFPMSA
jgi:short-subunit dehydrogenase involved in D-alanine esterification of teichoic acids